jgi:hypothetical protein
MNKDSIAYFYDNVEIEFIEDLTKSPLIRPEIEPLAMGIACSGPFKQEACNGVITDMFSPFFTLSC